MVSQSWSARQVVKSKVQTWVSLNPALTCSTSTALNSRARRRLRTLLSSVFLGIAILLLVRVIVVCTAVHFMQRSLSLIELRNRTHRGNFTELEQLSIS